MNEKLIQIHSFDNPMDANMFKSKLESEGIECFMPDEQTVSANMFLSTAIGNIKVMVKESDYENAKKIINDFKLNLNLTDDQDDTEFDGNDHKDSCPECNSQDIYFYKHNRKGAAISIMLLGFPLIYPSKEWKCNSCSNTWLENKSLSVNVVRFTIYFVFIMLFISIIYRIIN